MFEKRLDVIHYLGVDTWEEVVSTFGSMAEEEILFTLNYPFGEYPPLPHRDLAKFIYKELD